MLAKNPSGTGKAIPLSEVQKEFDKAGIAYTKGDPNEAALKAKWPKMGLGR